MVEVRILRTYVRIAHQEHGNCRLCGQPIVPGDQYEGCVFVKGKKLWVEKQHTNCPVDPWEEDAKYYEQEEEESKPEVVPVTYRKAA